MMNNRDLMKGDILKGGFTNIRDRLFDLQNYPAQNPYESSLPANYYPYQTGYEL